MKITDVSAKYKKYMKARLSTIRIAGIAISLVLAVMMIMPYLGLPINRLVNGITLTYLSGFLFTHNSRYQELCHNKGWARANRVLAFLMYMATIALLILFILTEYVGIQL